VSRIPQPEDLLACLLSRTASFSSVALSRDGLLSACSPSPAALVMRQLLYPADERHVLIFVDRRRLRGLLTYRPRTAPEVWEVDNLLCEREGAACCTLLDDLSTYGSKTGIRKIFLRTEQDSPCMGALRKIGFSPCSTGHLYRRAIGRQSAPVFQAALRPRSGKDDFLLFQLYNAVVPASLRQAEGVTLQEWQASREKDAGKEIVYENEEGLRGWLRYSVIKGKKVFEIMTAASPAGVDRVLIEYVVTNSPHCRAAYCLAQESQGGLQGVLKDTGFELVGGYCVLLKQLVVPVAESCLAPLRA
jgi:hypothetical protein